MSKKDIRQLFLIDFFVVLVAVAITVFVSNFSSIQTYIREVSNRIYLASIDLSGMELSTVFVDRSGNESNTYTYHPRSTSGSTDLIYRIKYKMTNSKRAYAPNELVINIDKDLFNALGSTYYSNSYTVSADKKSSSVKAHMWSYETTTSGIKLYNNFEVDEGTSFVGSIDIVYSLTGNMASNDELKLGKSITDYKINMNNQLISTGVDFHLVTARDEYYGQIQQTSIAGLDGLQENIIWTKFNVKFLRKNNELQHVKYTSGSEPYVIFDLPSDVIIAKSNTSVLSGNKLVLTGRTSSITYATTIFLGFPADKYENSSTTIKGTFYAMYMDESSYSSFGEVSANVDIGTLVPSEETDLYQLISSQYYSNDILTTSSAINYKYSTRYKITPYVKYMGKTLDVMYGVDLALYEPTGGTPVKLTDDEYKINSVDFKTLYNINEQSIASKYDVDLYVRYKGSSTYEKYSTFKNTSKSFSFSSKTVVGYYFVIHNMTESISKTTVHECNISFNKPDMDKGKLYIIPFMKVTNSGTMLNSANDNTYPNTNVKQLVENHDNNTYGTKYQRKVVSVNVYHEVTGVKTNRTISTTEYSEYYKLTHRITPSIVSDRGDGLGEYTNHYQGYEIYVTLPSGVTYIDGSLKVNFSTGNYSFCYQDGTCSTDKEEYYNLIMRNLTYKVYSRGSDTFVKIAVDLSDTPLDVTSKNTLYENFTIDAKVTKEHIKQHSSSSSLSNTYYSYVYTYVMNERMEGAGSGLFSVDSSDYDGDGDKTEYYRWTIDSTRLKILNETFQGYMVYARSDISDPTKNALVVAGEDYYYRLKVQTSENKLTNVVLYDSIERYLKVGDSINPVDGDASSYHGTFKGINVTNANNFSYKYNGTNYKVVVKTYYSEKEQPGPLGTDTSWKEYNDSTTDKSKVKSLAFELLNNAGGKAIIPNSSELYIEIKMQAPSTNLEQYNKAYNGSWITWNYLDETNTVSPEQTELNSNIAKVGLATLLKTKHLLKGTDEVVCPEVDETYGFGSEYTTSQCSLIATNMLVDEIVGDDASGTISKPETVVTYYYDYKEPTLTYNPTVTATPSIDKRSDTVQYSLKVDYSVQDYLDYLSYYEIFALPYEIDETKSDLSDGVYDSTTKMITWETSTYLRSTNKSEYSSEHNISVVYKNLPIDVTEIETDVRYGFKYKLATSMSTGTNTKVKTSVLEQYKITVKHLEDGTNNPLADEEYIYKRYGEEYTTNPSANIPSNYKVKITPDNASSTVSAEETEVVYYYDKKTPVLTNTNTITGPTEIDSRTKPVEYNIKNTSTVKDYIGAGTLDESLTLPYEIDETESNLDGGTYNNSTKKITWSTEYTTFTTDETNINTTHNISLIYKGITIDIPSINVIYNSTISNSINSEDSSNNYTTAIKEKYKITVKHLEDGTNAPLTEDDTYYKYYNEEYEVNESSAIPDNYQLKTKPDNYKGKVLSEETIVIYYYEKKIPILDGNVTITAPESIDNRLNEIEYKISYTGSVKTLIGDYNVSIIDTLPYEIDETKSDLDGGTYDESSKTISWNNIGNTTTINQKDISYEYNIKIVYKDVPISAVKYSNKVSSTLSAESTIDIRETIASTNILEKYKLIVKHLETDTNKELAQAEEYYKLYDEEYTTSVSDDVQANYDVAIIPSNYRGNIKAEVTEVIYYYQMIDSDLVTEMQIDYPEEINKLDETVSFKINYKMNISNYLGESKVLIKDTLPYELDLDESELDGGVYDIDTKTITWELTDTIDTLDETIKEYVLGVQLLFKDVDINEQLVNNVTASVILDNNSNVKETSLISDIRVYGNIKVKYIDIDTGESISDDINIRDFIGTEYMPVSKNIEDYNLVETPKDNTLVVERDDQTIYYKYKKRPKETIEDKVTTVNENPATGEFKLYWLLVLPIAFLGILLYKISKRNIFKRYV